VSLRFASRAFGRPTQKQENLENLMGLLRRKNAIDQTETELVACARAGTRSP
jgi:hypothetical protein